MLIVDYCNKCGKYLSGFELHEVTCSHITFWEHDTRRYLCDKCYNKFQKYMRKHYESFFDYLNKMEIYNKEVSERAKRLKLLLRFQGKLRNFLIILWIIKVQYQNMLLWI